MLWLKQKSPDNYRLYAVATGWIHTYYNNPNYDYYLRTAYNGFRPDLEVFGCKETGTFDAAPTREPSLFLRYYNIEKTDE